MPSLLHEALLLLFRNRPELAPELLRDALHAALPAYTDVRVDSAELTEIVPTEYRADLVVLLLDGVPVMAIVVEAQLQRDADKRWTWPVYLTALRARLRCPTSLLVVTVDSAVARWAAEPITLGHAGFVLTPLVLGPDAMPIVTEPAEAARAPELAVLSAMAHGHSAHAVDVALAALGAAAALDDERAVLYADLVRAALNDAARAALEALMQSQKYEFQSDFAKKYVAIGKAEGEANAILTVLAARGIEISDAVRQRIVACSDIEELDRWLRGAATCASPDEIFA